MDKNRLAQKIKEKALSLGFDGCGIIPVSQMQEYEEKLNERMEACPASKPMLEGFRKYGALQKKYEWAKSVLVCIVSYDKFHFPKELEGLIGKYYLYDYKLQPQSVMSQHIAELESYIVSLGIKAAKELHGATSGRMAAAKAGLGVVRKNNFFYTKKGSWVIIETWVIDCELELSEETTLSPCPKDCRKCIEACPTQALRGEHCTDMATCVTRLTWGLKDLPSEDMRIKMKTWLYGCDDCQNACPFNQTAWKCHEDYPEINELSEAVSLEDIVMMDGAQLKALLGKKFWFITPENMWIWKANALRAMANSYKEEYKEVILSAAKSENEKIREMAEWATKRNAIDNF